MPAVYLFSDTFHQYVRTDEYWAHTSCPVKLTPITEVVSWVCYQQPANTDRSWDEHNHSNQCHRFQRQWTQLCKILLQNSQKTNNLPQELQGT